MKKRTFPFNIRLMVVWGIALCFVFTAFAQNDYFEQTAGPIIGGQYVRTYRLAINTQDQIFASTDSGVFRSEDNGDHWTRINNGLDTPLKIIPIVINSKGHIFISNMNDVYRSTDNGENWVKVTNNMTEPAFDIAIDSVDTVFAGKYRSGDNGSTWKKITNMYCDPYDPRPINGYPTWHIVIGPTGEVIIANFQEMYRSEDYGENWQKILSTAAIRIGPIAITKQDYILALIGDSAKYICPGSGFSMLLRWLRY